MLKKAILLNNKDGNRLIDQVWIRFWHVMLGPLLHVNTNCLLRNLHNINIYLRRDLVSTKLSTNLLTTSSKCQYKMREPNNLWSKLYAVGLYGALWKLDTLSPFFYYELLLIAYVLWTTVYTVHVYICIFWHTCTCVHMHRMSILKYIKHHTYFIFVALIEKEKATEKPKLVLSYNSGLVVF